MNSYKRNWLTKRDIYRRNVTWVPQAAVGMIDSYKE